MYVYMFLCMNVCMHVCMYVCMYVYKYEYMYVCTYEGFICMKYTWFHCTHCDIYFFIQALVSRRVRTNELIRTFDLHYVTKSNSRKHPYSSSYIASEYTLDDSFRIRQDLKKNSAAWKQI